uniref:Uncharacterized protein n=1 Tax=Panagrolaimus sp. PS1159 TaxID=55785 RepID=A0AC35FWV3_9BILA
MSIKDQSLKSYICKDYTQQDEFLKKYPDYDGRGILIAIIDATIADISLPGMQKTTNGLSKIVDCFDFSCERYIDISTVKEVDFNNTLFGLSGLKLKV